MVPYLLNSNLSLNIFSVLPFKGEEHLHPQRDVLHRKRPPDSDTKGQETGAEGVLQGEDRAALQQHLHVKASFSFKHLNTKICFVDHWPAVGQSCDTLGLTCFGKTSQTWPTSCGRFKMHKLKQIKERKWNTLHIVLCRNLLWHNYTKAFVKRKISFYNYF